MIRLGDAYSGRPQAKLQKMFMGGSYGLVFADDYWRNQKRFALRVLRDFGFGKPILEDTIIGQVKEIQQILKNTKSEPFIIRKLITVSKNFVCAKY